MRTPAAQPAVARQVHGGGREELLTFRGGTGSLPVVGSVSRDGTEEGQVITSGLAGACSRPESTPRDCGTRAFPANTTVGGLEFLDPAILVEVEVSAVVEPG